MTRPLRTTTATRTSSSNPVPADVLVALGELHLDVEKVRNEEAWCRCPGPHAERVGKEDGSASWSINLDTGEHHCFSCGWGGPFIVLVNRFIKDPDEAALWVRKRGGIAVARARLEGKRGYSKVKADPVTEADLAFFVDPPAWARKDKDVNLESLQAFGVLWDAKTSSWIFPVRDLQTDQLLGWQIKNKRFFNNFPEHLEKSETIFGSGLYKQRACKTAYVYESPVDAVRLDTYGLEGTLSTYGVHVSRAQMLWLADNVETLYWCLDNDGAGREMEREIWTEYRSWFPKMYFAYYDHTDLKDHGEMPIEDVQTSLDLAIPAVRFRP